MGKKFLFMDLVECPEPKASEEEKAEPTGRVHHGLGDHTVRSDGIKRIDFDHSKSNIVTVVVAERDDHIPPADFQKLCADLCPH